MLGVQTDEEQIDDMVREVDVDGDGDIDFQEFVMMIRKWGSVLINNCFVKSNNLFIVSYSREWNSVVEDEGN